MDLTSQNAVALERGEGWLHLRFKQGAGGVTRLAHLDQHAPARALFPLAEPGFPPEAVLITTSGGLADGDRIDLTCALEPRTQVRVAAQAAEKIYRARGAEPARVTTRLTVAAGARLDWLPQETILFDGGRLDRSISADVAPSGWLTLSDMIVFGRIARDERFRRGFFADRWTLFEESRPVWREATRLEGSKLALLDHRYAYAGAESVGLWIGQGRAATTDLRDALRDALGDAVAGAECRAGVTLLDGVVIVRLLGGAQGVRRAMIATILAERRHAGLTADLPRVWHS